MSNRHYFGGLLLAGLLGATASQASAERIKESSAKANKEFDRCMDSGATEVERGGVRSCIDRNGHGIVCGGVKAEHKGTCDTFRRVPKNPWALTVVELNRMNVKRRTAR